MYAPVALECACGAALCTVSKAASVLLHHVVAERNGGGGAEEEGGCFTARFQS